MRSARSTTGSRPRRRSPPRRLLPRHRRHQRGRRPPLRPALVRRHAAPVLSAGHPEPGRPPRAAADLGRWRDAMAAVKRLVGPRCRCHHPAEQRMGAGRDPGAAAGRGAAEGRCRVRRFRAAPASARRSPSTSRCSRTASPRPATSAEIANLYQEFAERPLRHVHQRPLEPRRVREPPAGRAPGCLGDRADAGARSATIPGVSLAGGASLAIRRTSAHQDAAWKLIEFLSRHGAAGPLLRAQRQPAGPHRRLAGPGAGRRSRARGPSSSSCSGSARPPRSRSGSGSRPRSPGGSTSWCAASARPTRTLRGARRRRRPDPREAALAAAPAGGGAAADAGDACAPPADGGIVRAGFWFALPALALIAVFFVLPVARRAGAQPHRLRHLRARPPRLPALRRRCATTAACSRTRCSGGRCSTPSTSC